MVHLGELDVSETHPLVSELSSLRAAVAQFQDEAHNSSIKFQRYSLHTANTNDRLAQLEHENAFLKSEIAVLRAYPHPDTSSEAHPAVTQVQQLTLSLRRLSDKLSLTEEALLTRTTELAHATAEATRARLAADGAYELAARTRGREETGKVREMELEWRVKAAEEAVKMSDLVVNEYADLVRSLEAKAGMRTPTHSRSNSSSTFYDASVVQSTPSATAPAKLADSLVEGKLGLQRLLSEFSTITEKLQAEVFHLHGEIAASQAKHEAERQNTELCEKELAKARFELQTLKLDDNAAAKMVSRYMQFSQKSTNNLQEALATLQTRHAATIETLSAQIAATSSRLEASKGTEQRLRYALDELGADILKETYGRRREVALRIRMVNREEKIREELERWIRRADEAFTRDSKDGRSVHERMLNDARALLLSTLDGPPTTSPPSSGSLARIIAAQSAVEFLSNELQSETARRLELERFVAQSAEYDGSTITVNPVLSVIPPSSPESSQTTNELAALPQDAPGDADASLPSPKAIGSSLPPAGDVSAKTFDDSLGESVPYITLVRSMDPDDVLSKLDSTLPTLPTVLEDDQGPRIPAVVITSDDTPPQSSSVSNNGDAIISDLPVSDVLAEMNEELESSPGIRPAPDVDLGPFEISHPSESRELVQQSVNADAPSPEAVEIEPTAWDCTNPLEPLEPGAEQAPVLESSTSSAVEAIPSCIPSTLPNSDPGLHYSPLVQSDISSSASQHPLLDSLLQVRHRYDDLQRAFRDCHLALEVLKSSMPTSSSTSNTILSVQTGGVSTGVLQIALDRLNDYTEDARVELEIQIADEALVAHGFETLLSVPGALSSASISSLSHVHDDHEITLSQSDVETQIEAFVSGTEPGVQKSQQRLSRKLDDIQHDIASIKLAVHDAALASTPLTAPASSGGGGGWTSWIRSSPSMPSTPASAPVLGLSPGLAPTFGNVMTSPRLRHSPSLNLNVQPKKGNPFAGLGLRVPMPGHVPESIPQAPQRSRTVSTMYMLGLGARRPGASGSFVSAAQQTSKLSPRADTDTDAESSGSAEEEDVE